MLENVYFASTAIFAPELSSTQVVISIGEKDITINPYQSRRDRNKYLVRYKTIGKLVYVSDFGYDPIVFKITFFGPNSQPTASGKIEFDPKEFQNQVDFEIQTYTIPVAGIEGVAASIGIAVVADGQKVPSGFSDCSDEGVARAHVATRDWGIYGYEEIVQSEGGRFHRRKKGTHDYKDGVFVAADGTLHRRKRLPNESSSPSSSKPPPPPPPPPPPTTEGSIYGYEEIVQSEGGRFHRRKKGTHDTADGTFIAEDGTVHRRKRLANEGSSPSSSNPTPSPTTEGSIYGYEEVVQSEGGRFHRRKKGTHDNKDGVFIAEDGTIHRRKRLANEGSSPSSSNPTPSPTTEGSIYGYEEVVQSEGGRFHRRKKGTHDNKDGVFIAEDGTIHRRKRLVNEGSSPSSSNPTPSPTTEGSIYGHEEKVESEGGPRHRRKKGTHDNDDGTFIAEDGTVYKKRKRKHPPLHL